MHLQPTAKVVALFEKVDHFLEQSVYPAAEVLAVQRAEGGPHLLPGIPKELKAEAADGGLRNLFLPHATPWNEPLTNIGMTTDWGGCKPARTATT